MGIMIIAFILFLTTRVASGFVISKHCHQSSFPDRCESCETSWWGDMCERRCNGHCDTAGCHQDNGICLGCGAGYYTDGCTTPCPANCLPSEHQRAFCQRNSGKCIQGCNPGWWGGMCEEVCNGLCDTLGCRRDNGICFRCRAGYYGKLCATTCPENCAPSNHNHNKCERIGGVCADKCRDGWWGDMCEKKCTTSCDGGVCFRRDGECAQACAPSLSGKWCKIPCPKHCALSQDGERYCRQDSKECRDGCQDGWWGDLCELECHTNCINKSCYRTGSCIEGCIKGWTGVRCDDSCPHQCRDKSCFYDADIKSISCIYGCREGWSTINCSKKCPADSWKHHQCDEELSHASRILPAMYPLSLLGFTIITTNM